MKHYTIMEQTSLLPTRAYDLLESNERQAVDEYVVQAIAVQHQKRERIIHALDTPIPHEYMRRYKGLLSKPLVRAALAEKIQEEANKQDISPDRIIAEHANIAFSNIADYMTQSDFGEVRVKSLDQITRNALAAVKKLETIPSQFGIRTSILLHDKLTSLNVLSELMGLVTPAQPVLKEYVRDKPDEDKNVNTVPETLYSKLLEG